MRRNSCTAFPVLLLVMLALCELCEAAQTVLCPGAPGEAPRWVHDEKDCQAAPTRRTKDPRERAAEKNSLDARKIRDQLAADRLKAASTPGISAALPYALPVGLAAAAVALIAQQQAAGASAPRLPRTYGELLANPDPADQWKAFSTRLTEQVVALKLQRPGARPGGGIVDITPQKVGITSGPKAGRDPLSPNPNIAPPLRRVESQVSEKRGSESKLVPEGAAAKEPNGDSSSISAEDALVPMAGAKEEEIGQPDGKASKDLGTPFSFGDEGQGSSGKQKSGSKAGTDGKVPAETAKSESKPGEELDLFEKALGMVDSVLGAVATPVRRDADSSSIFAQVHVQYRKRERILAP